MPILTHIALHVRDLDACVRFYQEYCGLVLSHDRGQSSDRVVWLAEPGKEDEQALVLIAGGPESPRAERDYGHLGFACPSREDVDRLAARAEAEGRLLWPAVEEPYPVAYYCGVLDPDGNAVEFSYGQPLGPGAFASG